MGVMRCDRADCENILCDWYSSEYGYLCNDCMTELRSLVPSVTVYNFMTTPKYNINEIDTQRQEALDYIDRTFTRG